MEFSVWSFGISLCYLILFSFCHIVNCTGHCDGITPCISVGSANALFQQCCHSKGLDSCAKHCRYDVPKKEIQDAILLTKECPIEGMRDYLNCAADNKDNGACCKATKIYDQGRAVCEPFCNPNSDDWPQSTAGMAKYAKCLNKFKEILKCHWASRR